jgi:hypothetical protein
LSYGSKRARLNGDDRQYTKTKTYPNKSPKTTLPFLMNGEPKSSIRIMNPATAHPIPK